MIIDGRQASVDMLHMILEAQIAQNTTLPNGAWFVYSADYGYHPLALFSDELSALRWVDEHDYGRVVFWPFKQEWRNVQKHD